MFLTLASPQRLGKEAHFDRTIMQYAQGIVCMNYWAVRRGECYGLVGEWRYTHSNTINFCVLPLCFGMRSLTNRECVARKTLHLCVLHVQIIQDFAIMSRGDTWRLQQRNHWQSVEYLSCIYAFSGPKYSVCHYLRPMPICCTIVFPFLMESTSSQM